MLSAPMTLAPGARFGPYEIVSQIGKGGMGVVYRARDARLARDVAIKVLPGEFASDPGRLARFEREARLLASLNHPNVASVYGFEESEGVRALVMELVEGATLADRIAEAPIPLEDALPIAKQIAEGLEYAHEQGIVHRDVKPANVKVRPDGTVKVLDLGLAKALHERAPPQDASSSPTLSAMETAAGVILGTAAYMSPEQVKGRGVDRRADVWAFGAVLYETLSGRRPFPGEDPTETMAAVLRAEPDWSLLPSDLPSSIRVLLERCLTKDPRERLQAIGEARILLSRPLASPTTMAEPAAFRRTALPWALAGVGLLAALFSLGREPSRPGTVVRMSAELGADASLFLDRGTGAILSPDGAVLAFTARATEEAPSRLYVRRLDQLHARALSGTDGAMSPFFSPDGSSIGFFADGKLKKVPTIGGTVVALADALQDRGGSWAEDGTIVFAPTDRVPLYAVPSEGGRPEAVTRLDEAEMTHRWPQLLPEGNAVLYTAHGRAGDYDGAVIVAQALRGGKRIVVQEGGYHGRYARSGHLLYIHEGVLYAVPFDAERLSTTGVPRPVLEDVFSDSTMATAQFALSNEGALVYVPGADLGGETVIDWLNREGNVRPLRAVPGDYRNLRVSPDGTALAMDVSANGQRDVWAFDWERGTMSRLTFDPGEDVQPIWARGGRGIIYSSTREGQAQNLYLQSADGSGQVERLSESKNQQLASSWHPTMEVLAFHENAADTSWDILTLALEGSEADGWKPSAPRIFLNTPYSERDATFSPDGRWLAYQSNESGRYEIYVQPFPGGGGKQQVSVEGGHFPVWSSNGRELFYMTEVMSFMVVAYDVEGGSLRFDKPQLWSGGTNLYPGSPRIFRNFDLHPDGSRLAVLRTPTESKEVERDHVTLVFNFFNELRKVAPEDR
jgi:serine/threonine-protein kinase